MNKRLVHEHLNVFVKGAMEFFFLSELERGPASGKELMEKIDFVTGEHWRPSPGTTYPVLRRMEKKGLVKASLAKGGGRRKIRYCLTPRGQTELRKHRSMRVECGDIGLEVMLPLEMRTLYGFSDEEITGLHKKLRNAFKKTRKPRNKEESMKALDKLIAAWREFA